MILKRKKHHSLDIIHSDYFILAVGLSLGSLAYFALMNQPALQAGAVVITGLFYILWGIVHHAREGDFHFSIVLEYTLIGCLAMALLLTLIFRT